MFTNLRLVVDEITRRGYVYYALRYGNYQTFTGPVSGVNTFARFTKWIFTYSFGVAAQPSCH